MPAPTRWPASTRSFCVKYREFAKAQLRSMRQVHIAGKKLFIDDAGDTVPLVAAATGEMLGVTVKGASVSITLNAVPTTAKARAGSSWQARFVNTWAPRRSGFTRMRSCA